MSSPPIEVILVAALLLVGADAAAQQPDTLRYHEVTTGEMRITSPAGEEVPFRTRHDVALSVLPVTADLVLAWYDRITFTATTPDGERRPDASEAVGELFVLRIDSVGHYKALVTPEFPESLRGLTDLRYQFTDFFPARLPGRLRAGASWADTLRVEELERGDSARGETVKVAQYTIRRDTLVAGTSAWIIEAPAELTLWSEGPLEGQPGVTVRVELDGRESNTFIVDGRGRLIRRVREAELSGVMRYLGLPQALELPLTRSYVNTIDLRRE